MTLESCLDWYDGPVTAVVRLADGERFVLAVLLGYRPGCDRIYGIFSLEDPEMAALDELSAPKEADDHWDEKHDVAVAAVLQREHERFILCRCAQPSGRVTDWVEIAWAPYTDRLGWTIEQAAEPGVFTFWMDLLHRKLSET